MEQKTNTPTSGVQNASIDALILHELAQQARWRARFADWEERQRRQRRLRLLPVVSNIMSVAAMLVLGFVLQTLLPSTKLADRTAADQMIPKIEQMLAPADSCSAGAGEAAPGQLP